MRCRPLDEYGDMVPVKTIDDMWEGKQAVSQAIRSRIRMVLGEWWEDETLGFEVPRFLIEGMKENNLNMLVGYVAAYILETKGVASIEHQEYIYAGRQLAMLFTVRTDNGETAEGSVDMYELLSAVSG